MTQPDVKEFTYRGGEFPLILPPGWTVRRVPHVGADVIEVETDLRVAFTVAPGMTVRIENDRDISVRWARNAT